MKDGKGFHLVLLPEVQINSIQVEFPRRRDEPMPGATPGPSASA